MTAQPFQMELTELPEQPSFEPGIRRAPSRGFDLSRRDAAIALRNALRYVPVEHHGVVAPEFLRELVATGRIYGYRYRPAGRIVGHPIEHYRGRILEARAMQVMIDNNLDFDVALYPYELVTYGESGQVCQNWMQYRLIKRYLEVMTADQTLVVSSGHPLGLFPSRPEAPRAVVTNGLMVGMFDTPEDFHRLAAMGCVNYGQMTAGGWMYIGPQGIVHGTYITLLNAGRLYLGVPDSGDLRGHTFVSSGLGGMSGAQGKALEIAGGAGIIAEVDRSRIETRLAQGWVTKATADIAEAVEWMIAARDRGQPVSVAYHGNVVDLLEHIDRQGVDVELLSDQTSCHVPYDGGYTPAGLTFERGREMLRDDRDAFRRLVDVSLGRHFEVLQRLCGRGVHFWDYGNSFMKAVLDAGVTAIARNRRDATEGFIWPSYVEDIMGPMCFDFGYGPFRWVCLSGEPSDLRQTDRAAMDCIDPDRRGQDRDNWQWIRDAEANRLVVGTQARILYADAEGRTRIARRFNSMVREGRIGPVMMGRDHHDTGGTDSPFRETANIADGSNLTSDMAHQCWAGNAARGMTMAVLSNGGGVGTGKAINGGFGLVLDGSERVDRILDTALEWDAMSGVSRRAWARNPNAIETVTAWNGYNAGRGHVTVPAVADDGLVNRLVAAAFERR
ncbi:MAG TPA: urocanate hydratase [Thermoanaerobaculales bacterium]|nr:urocanate hydratase [Thermoanaerobaculales bacterium]HPA79168.1 urocanate hydratase [Thermoanaerobaculales bacterium]HQL29163.1 urocanate hydratase [Thermoanaerobaculales bacterium]HQN95085.1 urocanate hydratase [Thermoanaerobaculales bacterium]HQP43243.1 urocanate hydratase [Thermoanaerobaculales bacterium]